MGLQKDKSHRKYTFDDVVMEFEKTDYILLSDASDYKDAATNSLKYMCPRHLDKGILTISLGHLQSGRGCYFCGREITEAAHILSKDDNEAECRQLCKSKGFEYRGVERINGKYYIKYICPNHREAGVQYMQKGNMNRDNIVGCPYCFETKKFKFSKGEKRVEETLNDLNVISIKQYTFCDCRDINMLPFDFYLPQERKAIEYDGQHHFYPVQFNGVSKEQAIINHEITIKHDLIKNDYCNKNNIGLLRIPYYEYNNIEKLVYDFLERKII